MRRFFLALFFTLASGIALAVQPGEQLADPALEARARALSEGLRCMVCQNQSIDDSEAALAKDVRLLVRERLSAGDSDAQVNAFLVARYGDFILLKPPVKASTLLLWAAPFSALLLGLLFIGRAAFRKPPVQPAPVPLSDQEQRALDAALAGDAERAQNLTKISS